MSLVPARDQHKLLCWILTVVLMLASKFVLLVAGFNQRLMNAH